MTMTAKQHDEVNENIAQQTHDDNGHSNVNNEEVQNKYHEILKEVISVHAKEIECPLHTQENSCLIHEYFTQNEDQLESSLPPDVPL